ncbi:hypothetical protein FHG87_020349 [Trinorchestia longiramus]|nr:hypothetical protein FHG87_020349 [Trinorchestia longiramus]
MLEEMQQASATICPAGTPDKNCPALSDVESCSGSPHKDPVFTETEQETLDGFINTDFRNDRAVWTRINSSVLKITHVLPHKHAFCELQNTATRLLCFTLCVRVLEATHIKVKMKATLICLLLLAAVASAATKAKTPQQKSDDVGRSGIKARSYACEGPCYGFHGQIGYLSFQCGQYDNPFYDVWTGCYCCVPIYGYADDYDYVK